MIPTLSPNTAFESLKDSAVLLDVREEYEVTQVSFDVAEIVYIPMKQIAQRVDELPRDRKIIVACAHAQRSAVVCDFLMGAGFVNVFNLQGGIAKWMKDGLPVK